MRLVHEDAQAPPPKVTDELTFPWGDVEVLETGLSEEIQMFRNLPSGLGRVATVADLGNMSHFVLKMACSTVRDVGSKTRTLVNIQLIDGQPVAISNGDQVAFSCRLVTTVRLD